MILPTTGQKFTDGPTLTTNTDSPLDIFNALFDQELIDLILLSQICIVSKTVLDCLNEAELRAILGMLILMGLDTLPSIRLCWSTDTNCVFNVLCHFTIDMCSKVDETRWILVKRTTVQKLRIF